MKKQKDMYVSAVVVAAGRGSRMNMDMNKQYIEIAGKQVLARTLQVFQDCACIDEIVLVVNQQDILYCKQNIVDFYKYTKVSAIVAGGSERQNSVYNGLREVHGECSIVLIHDGARPFIKAASIIASIDAAREYGASCVAVPVKDTVKMADKGHFVVETLDRSSLWAMQTPQTFKYEIIMDAHRKALEKGFTGTDDATLVEQSGGKVKLVMGGYDNIKITTREDLIMAEAIANEAD